MKKLMTVVMLTLLSFSAFAELVNVNPDKTGEPWLVGGLSELTAEDWKVINSIPKLDLSSRSKALPSSVDNSLQPAFRPIFSQQGGSCGQASGVGYDFTYEMNTARGLAANTTTNQYPTHFTWNYINNGVGNGSWYFTGWDIIKDAGCPNVADYGGSLWEGGDKRWMSGYAQHFNGLHNRVTNRFDIQVGTPAGLNTFKQWVYDHGNGSAKGGIGCFAAGASGYTMTTLPAGTPNAGKKVMTRWGTDVNHAMTFVGYDDNVKFDYNGDGLYTNNKDTNGDGVIDMRDWEVGAVIVVNSWGTGWGDNGHCYVPYRLLAETPANGGIWNHSIMVIEVAPQTNPLLVLKVKVKYTARARINLTASMNTNTSATTGVNAKTFELAKNRGGDLFMQGGTTEDQKTIEYALDISSFMQYISNYQPVKLFFTVNENDPSNIGTGSIVSMSVIDHISGQNYPAEIVCTQSNKTINQGATTVSVVKYTWGNNQTYRNPDNPANTVNGLDYKYYQGDWNALPNFAALTPASSSTIANFSISGAPQADYFGYSFTGFVNVPTDGVYTFYTSSDDGSKLYIGTTLVVGNDGLHPAVEQSGQIGLKAGKHAVRVEFFEKNGGQVLEVRYQGPGISKQLIPNSALYRVQTASGPAGYTWCANENQSYTLTGSCDVAYGANGQYYYKYYQTGTITFNNATFGDPIPGVQKAGFYKTAATLRPADNPANTVNGLDYKYYQGDWNALPNFAALTPVTSSTIANFSISGAPQADYFGYSFTGFVNVPTDGVYTFYTSSDDGSKLYIGTTLVVGNDGLHPAVEQSGQIGLKAGKHAVRVEFFEKNGGQVLEVRYQGPGISKQLIPNSALYRIEQISTNDVLGFYMRLPVLNTWHTGVIEMSGSTMQWRNSAGVTWPLIPDLANEKLLTTSACPYYSNANGKAFTLKTIQNINGTKTVEGFWFLNELYTMSSNIAKGKPTSQSSTYPGGDSYKAVDGNTNGAWGNGSVTHTQYNAQAWWYVDLGAACGVHSVILWNRAECSERLSNFHIDYYDVNGYFMLRKDYPGTAGSKTVIDFPANGVRFVMVQLNGTNYLSLAEVEVMGIVGVANPGGQAEITEEAIPAGISGKPENRELIKDVRLFQNKPNPFTSGTLIDYQSPANGRVEIVVYNMAGQKVRTLVDGRLPAGRHAAHWDGRDEAGTMVPAGVYLARLNANGTSRTRKLMLVR